MKYEQEKNKINKLWEKSQNNTNELDKKTNDSLIQSPNNFKNLSKSLISPIETIKTPYYVGKSVASIWLTRYDFCVDYMHSTGGAYFYSDYQFIEIILTGNNVLRKKITCEPNWYEGSDPPLQNGWKYEWDSDILNIFDYDTTCTLITRPYLESYNRWGTWSEPISIYIYPFYPIPPHTEFSFGVPSGSFMQSYDPSNTYMNNVFTVSRLDFTLYLVNGVEVDLTYYADHHLAHPTFLAVPYLQPHLYVEYIEAYKCKKSIVANGHTTDAQCRLQFYYIDPNNPAGLYKHTFDKDLLATYLILNYPDWTRIVASTSGIDITFSDGTSAIHLSPYTYEYSVF